MEKIYKSQNGTIYVEIPESCDREQLRKVTEEFLRKALREENGNEHINKTRNFRKEQVLYR